MILASELGRRDVTRAATEAGITVEDVMVAPVPADPLGGEVVVRTPDGYVRGTHHWLGAPRTRLERVTLPYQGATTELGRGEIEWAVQEARKDRDVMHYLVWSRFPYYRVTPEPGGFRVRIADVRYDARGAGSLSGVEVSVGGLPDDSESSGSP
jgi:hypothetical protein